MTLKSIDGLAWCKLAVTHIAQQPLWKLHVINPTVSSRTQSLTHTAHLTQVSEIQCQIITIIITYNAQYPCQFLGHCTHAFCHMSPDHILSFFKHLRFWNLSYNSWCSSAATGDGGNYPSFVNLHLVQPKDAESPQDAHTDSHRLLAFITFTYTNTSHIPCRYIIYRTPASFACESGRQ